MVMQEFTATKARPLPVILMLDTSGSMSVAGKIDAMSQAVNDMIHAFAQESRIKAEIQLSIITFGGSEAKMHTPLSPVTDIELPVEFTAMGPTPLGGALDIVTNLIEDKEKLPTRAYKPTIVLVSDGYPNDRWEESFAKLQNSERAKKAVRMAMAIGEDADKEMLTSFINDNEAPLFEAHNSAEIQKFFRAVSMSVSTRSKSSNPNQIAILNYDDIDYEMIENQDDE